MPKIKNIIFSAIFFNTILFLIFIAFFFNPNYFLANIFPNKTSLPFFHHAILIFGQLFCITIAISLFLFRKKVYKKRKEFILLLTAIVIPSLLIIEIGSRIYLCNFASNHTKSKMLAPGQCGLKSKYEQHHYLNYHGTPNYISPDGLNIHNSLGFRGPEIIMPKPRGLYRIVVLGGSTTYTISVDNWKEDFARQLEKQLKTKFDHNKIEVINAGLGGWNSWESLINLQINILDLKPDLIIINHGVNDVHARLVNPEYYKSDNSGRRKQWDKTLDPLFFRLTSLRIITAINPFGGLSLFVDAPTSKAGIKETGFIKELDGTPIETLRKNKPIYFERNLRSMIAIAKEHNASVLLATWTHNNKFNDYAATSHYEFGFKQNNEVVKKVAEDKGVPVYDFASEMSQDKQFWSDGRHVNEKGSGLKGELFANYIFNNTTLNEKIYDLIQ